MQDLRQHQQQQQPPVLTATPHNSASGISSASYSWTCCNPECASTNSSSSQPQLQQQHEPPAGSTDSDSSSDSGSSGPFGGELYCQSGGTQHLVVKVLLPEDLAVAGAATVLQSLAATVKVGGCVLALPYCSLWLTALLPQQTAR
jgi:hypothetical protein